MPVPGTVQGQNPTQGLVHWMSAVMAEHITSNTHHDPAVGMHYMWNGSVDFSKYEFFYDCFYDISGKQFPLIYKKTGLGKPHSCMLI